MRIARHPVRKLDIYVLERRASWQRAEPGPNDDFTVIRATEDQLPDLRDFDTPQRVDAVRGLWKDGHRVYLAYVDGRCVHRTLVKVGPCRQALYGRVVWRTIPSRMGWIHWVRTDESVWGQGVYPRVLQYIAEESSQMKLRMAVEVTNSAALRAAAKAGYRPVSRLRSPVVFGVLLRDDETKYTQRELVGRLDGDWEGRALVNSSS